MEILFKNTTQYNKEKYEEFLKFHKNKFKHSYTMYSAVILLGLLFCLGAQIRYQGYVEAVIIVCIMIAFILWRYWKPAIEVRKDYNSKKIQKSGKITFYFYENQFKVEESKMNETIKYKNLYKVFDTDKFFYLYTDKTHAYLVEKERFVKGNNKEFTEFIKNKMFIKYKKISK